MTILLLVFYASLASGRANKIQISKATQADSPIEFSVTIPAADDNQLEPLLVKLSFPSGQKELTDLWKVCLLIVQEKKTVLVVPLDLNYGKDKTVNVIFFGHVDILSQCLIAIRCGEDAPFKETIYEVNIGSYLKKD